MNVQTTLNKLKNISNHKSCLLHTSERNILHIFKIQFNPRQNFKTPLILWTCINKCVIVVFSTHVRHSLSLFVCKLQMPSIFLEAVIQSIFHPPHPVFWEKMSQQKIYGQNIYILAWNSLFPLSFLRSLLNQIKSWLFNETLWKWTGKLNPLELSRVSERIWTKSFHQKVQKCSQWVIQVLCLHRLHLESKVSCKGKLV